MSAISTNLIRTTGASFEVAGQRTYAVLYQVKTNNPGDQVITALQASDVPSIGSFYVAGNDVDYGSYVASYAVSLVEEDNDDRLWNVVVNYTGGNGGSTGSDKQEDPTDPTQATGGWDQPWNKPARVSGAGTEFEVQSQLHYSDATNINSSTLLRNSAGELSPEKYSRIFTVPSLRIEQDFETWPANLEDYVNAINSVAFFGAAVGEYRMTFPTWRKLYTGQGLEYYNIVFEFAHQNGGWNGADVYDFGYRVLNPDNASELLLATDGFGTVIFTPVSLDGSGYQNAVGADPVLYPSGGVDGYIEKDFGDLGIPTTR